MDSHSAVAQGGKAKSLVQTHGAAGGKVFVECTGDVGRFTGKKKIRQDGSAKPRVKGLATGLYTCSVVKLKDADRVKLCRDQTRPVNVTVD